MKKIILTILCIFSNHIYSSQLSEQSAIDIAIKNSDYQAFIAALKNRSLTEQERITYAQLNLQINRELGMHYTLYLRSHALSLLNPAKLAARIIIGEPNRYTLIGLAAIASGLAIVFQSDNIKLACVPVSLGIASYIKGRIISWKSNNLSQKLSDSNLIHKYLTVDLKPA
jgi:hypothetical protein